MPSSENKQISGKSTQGPIESNEPLRDTLKTVAIAPEDPASVAAGIQSLFSLVSMMRTLNGEPAGSPLNPKIILSAAGVEVRFAGANDAVESVPAEMQASPEPLLPIEKELKELRQSNAALNAKIAAQNETLATLRASVEQTEQMMETLIDSMIMIDELGDAGLGPELVIPPGTLAS